MRERKYSWWDDDVVLILNRAYLEEDAAGQDRELVDEDGKIDDDTFEMLSEEIRERLFEFLYDCYSAVEERQAREERNRDADVANPHYRVYWKNENAFQSEYMVAGTYKNLPDARSFIRGQIKTEYDLYKIVRVKDGIEGKKQYPPHESHSLKHAPAF